MKIFSPTISGSSQTSGSLTISGSLNVSQGITGSLLGTASWATNVVNGGGGGSVGTLAQVTALGASTTVPITASIISASSFTGSLLGTASWAQSASNAINSQTASFLPIGTYNITASWAQSASNAINARTASFLPVGTYSITSSWATNALTASYILNAVSSSFATTASFALNGGVTSIAAGSGISINQSTGNVIITNASAGGATFPYTGSAIISGSLIVTGSTNSSGGFTGSLFGTASHAITASYALSSAGGGGGSFSLAGATDVSFSALADGDLIRYNGIAGKWQNTNLGLSLTPSLSAIEGGYFGGYAKITNWGSYSQPTAQAFIKSGSSTIITCSVDTSGQITWSDSNTNYNFTRSLSVQVQDFGDIASEITTASYVKQTASFRYYRWFTVSASSNVLLSDFRFYSGSAQTSTAFPANMTNSGSPAPYVASASSFYVGYPAWQAFDNSTATSWWNLASPPYQGAFVSIDMGSTFTSSLRSMRIQFGQSFQDFTVANIQGSNDNTTWTTIHTITNVPSANNSSARNFG